MLFDHPSFGAEGAGAANAFGGHSRRHFLKVSAAAGGGLLLALNLRGFAGEALAAEPKEFAPNAYVRIGRDGKVTIVVAQVEMGQGTFTSMPMLIAEELEVDLADVALEQAPPDDKLYANPLIGFQVTGGSTSVRGFWQPLREAGAAARMLLVEAAADTWGVDPNSLSAEKGEVVDKASGRKLAYGALADKAATYPVPEKVALKDPKDFQLIGKPAKRVDTPSKVNGSAKFGIDTLLPGLKFAAVAASPVFGGKLKSVDDSKARAVKGMRQIVKLDDVVAVIADHNGAARKGLAALEITWDDGPNAHFSSDDLIAEMSKAAKADGGRRRQGRRCRKGDRRRRPQDRGRLPASVPRPRRAGADELHRRGAQGRLRGVGRHAGGLARAGDRGEGDRPAAGAGQGA